MSVQANHPSEIPEPERDGREPASECSSCATSPNANNNRRSGLGFWVCF